MMTDKEIIAYNLRNTAIHEAGHLVVLMELGGSGFIRVNKEDESDLKNNSAYGGKTYIIEPLKNDDMRVMAIAGEIAVLFDSDPDLTEDEVIDHFEFEADTISDTDKAHGITYEAAEQALEILARRWGDVLHYAGNEIEKEAS